MPQINQIIYVSLLDEGTPTWRPADAIHVGDDSYQILPTQDYNPDSETWEFLPYSIVRCELRKTEDGTEVLLAVEKIKL